MTSIIAQIIERNVQMSPGDREILNREFTRLETAKRAIESNTSPAGKIITVRSGNLTIDASTGLRIFNPQNGHITVDIQPDGDAFFGHNVGEIINPDLSNGPFGLTLAVFSNDQTFRGEDVGQGDLLLGDNLGTNAFYDASAGRLNFRHGSTTYAYIGADGKIYAQEGEVAGWTLNTTYLAKDTGTDATSAGLAPSSWPFYSGATYANRASAPFRVGQAGKLYSTSADIGGWAVDSTTIKKTGIILDSANDLIQVGASAPYIQIDGGNKRIRSSDYASGRTGLNIDIASGNAEFNNITARGEMRGSTFVKRLIEARAGTSLWGAGSGVLADDMAVPGSGTWTMTVKDPPGGAAFLFANSDVCYVKNETASGISHVWFTVSARTDNGDGTQSYTCTYNSGTRNVTHKAGAPVVDYGQSGQGLIAISADGTIGSTANLTLFTHAGSPWSSTTMRGRIGNLNGSYGYATDIWGAAFGNHNSTNANITIDPTNGVRLRQGTTDKIVFDNSGNAYFANVVTLGTSGELRQGTGTVGTDFNGLRIWRDTNVGRIAGYNSSSTSPQWYAGTDGKLYMGNGDVILDADGITLNAPSTYGLTSSLKFSNGSTIYGELDTIVDAGTNSLELSALPVSGNNAIINIDATGSGSGKAGTIELLATNYNSDVVALYLESKGTAGSGVVNITGAGAHFGAHSSTALAEGVIETEGDIYTDAWQDYSATSTITGWSSLTTTELYYKKVGNTVRFAFRLVGTSDSTTATFTLPYTYAAGSPSLSQLIRVKDNGGSGQTGRLVLYPGSSTVSCYADQETTGFTASGTKVVHGEFWYETS